MRMEVYIELEGLKLDGILCDCFLRGPNGRLEFLARLTVKSIEVLAQTVQSVVTSRHSVRIKCRYNLEYEMLT